MLKNKKVLITGASGFLASELIEQLLALKKCEIWALSRNKQTIHEKYAGSVLAYDYQDLADDKIAFNQVDFVIHTAFCTQEDGWQLAESLKITKTIFEKALVSDCVNIINISSKSVYSTQKTLPSNEYSDVSPENKYAMAKYASELLLNSMVKQKQTNIRLASLIGVNTDIRVVNKFVEFALLNGEINIVGGLQKFLYMDVRDAASALIALMETKNWKPVYNLGTTRQHTIVEIAEIIKDVAKTKLNKDVLINLEEKDINLDVGMDSTLFYQDTAWRPKYSLEDTIKSIFDFKLKGMQK